MAATTTLSGEAAVNPKNLFTQPSYTTHGEAVPPLFTETDTISIQTK